MIPENINTSPRVKRVLITPLDWGLGHATRCIPIIRSLLNQGAEVIIAASGMSAKLLHEEFPDCLLINIEGYNIRYSGSFFRLYLLLQYFRIKKVIRQEHEWLQKAVAQYKIDAVISDNRYGMYARIPSVFLTHQLQIETGNKMLNNFARRINFNLIRNFSECWIADDEQHDIAGSLSRSDPSLPIPFRYTGILSRFKHFTTSVKYDYAIVLSGPEPQRTTLENKILEIVKHKNACLVRGLPGIAETLQTDMTVFNHLPARELNKLICESRMVICRSGYSSVMDLIKLKKKAILIPTPGQTEQEYLATYLYEKKMFVTCRESDLSNEIFNKIPFETHAIIEEKIDEVVKRFLDKL